MAPSAEPLPSPVNGDGLIFSWPVSLPSPSSEYFISTIPSLPFEANICFVPGRLVRLEWVLEGVSEIGMGYALDSIDSVNGRGMITIRLARTGFTVGVSVLIPLERYWGPYANVPTAGEMNRT